MKENSKAIEPKRKQIRLKVITLRGALEKILILLLQFFINK